MNVTELASLFRVTANSEGGFIYQLLATTQLATIPARVMMDSEAMDSTAQVWIVLFLKSVFVFAY